MTIELRGCLSSGRLELPRAAGPGRRGGEQGSFRGAGEFRDNVVDELVDLMLDRPLVSIGRTRARKLERVEGAGELVLSVGEAIGRDRLVLARGLRVTRELSLRLEGGRLDLAGRTACGGRTRGGPLRAREEHDEKYRGHGHRASGSRVVCASCQGAQHLSGAARRSRKFTREHERTGFLSSF